MTTLAQLAQLARLAQLSSRARAALALAVSFSAGTRQAFGEAVLARPSLSTVKKLFAKSSNRCAYPACKASLITNGVVTGELCHIRARSPGGPRYDAMQTDSERHADDNLLIMCSGHHKVIDSDLAKYNVASLLRMKAAHEATVTGPNSLTDEEATEFLVRFRIDVVATVNQSGGQTARQIVNFFPPPSSTPLSGQDRERIQLTYETMRDAGIAVGRLTEPSSADELPKDVSEQFIDAFAAVQKLRRLVVWFPADVSELLEKMATTLASAYSRRTQGDVRGRIMADERYSEYQRELKQLERRLRRMTRTRLE